MKKIFVLFTCLLSAYIGYCQPKVPASYFEEQIDAMQLRKHNLYFEGGGSSLIFGINYEQLKRQKNNHYLAFKTGFTYIPAIWTIPFTNSGLILTPGISYFWGETDQKLEIGAFTAINLGGQILPGLAFGLRDTKPNKVLLKLNFTPFFGKDGFRPFVGVSLGRNFGPKPKMANEEMIELLKKMQEEQLKKKP